MYKKESCFSLFKNCCAPQDEEKELIPQKEIKQRKEAKVSLKQVQQQSNSSTINTFNNRRSVQKGKDERYPHLYESTKEDKYSVSNLSYNLPNEKYHTQKIPLNERYLQAALKQGANQSLKVSNFKGENSGFSFETQLQRTAKIVSPKLKAAGRCSRVQEMNLQQTKQLSKGKILITNLDSFKQSLVSINDTATIHQKFEESMVMIDYFNPPSKKVFQIHNYLLKRE